MSETSVLFDYEEACFDSGEEMVREILSVFDPPPFVEAIPI